MKKRAAIYLDFEVDKLTRSIENIVSGDSFQTDITRLKFTDLKHTSKKNKWSFDWKYELQQNDRDVYKLTITNSPEIIQGLVSLTIRPGHVFMHLLESAPFNKGKNKVYNGVAGNLVAFACNISFQNGNEGFVSFQSKTKLITHYEKTLGAYHLGGNNMIIATDAAQTLVGKYFKT